MFVAGIFTEIRPVWVGDLETRPKNLKGYVFISWDFCFSAVGCSAKKIKNWELDPKKWIWTASMFTCLALRVFWNFEFFLCLKSVFVLNFGFFVL